MAVLKGIKVHFLVNSLLFVIGNPFYGGVDLTDVMGNLTSVTVEAINCNGQRVKVKSLCFISV